MSEGDGQQPGPPDAAIPSTEPVERPEPNTLLVQQYYLFCTQFMAQNGWYIVFALIVFAFFKKNIEGYLAAWQEWWEVAQIKKDPDQFQRHEDDRMAKLERLQRDLDIKAAAHKARVDAIEEERRARAEAARANGGGKETMARWEEERNKGTEETPKAHTIRKGAVKDMPRKPRMRGEYNPMTGDGGGASNRFKSSRASQPRGG